jgi:hypothetical protein
MAILPAHINTINMKYILSLMAIVLGLQVSAQNKNYTARDYGHSATISQGNLYKQFIQDSYNCEYLSDRNLRTRINMCTDRAIGNYVGSAFLAVLVWPVSIHTYSRGIKLARAAQRYKQELDYRNRR